MSTNMPLFDFKNGKIISDTALPDGNSIYSNKIALSKTAQENSVEVGVDDCKEFGNKQILFSRAFGPCFAVTIQFNSGEFVLYHAAHPCITPETNIGNLLINNTLNITAINIYAKTNPANPNHLKRIELFKKSFIDLCGSNMQNAPKIITHKVDEYSVIICYKEHVVYELEDTTKIITATEEVNDTQKEKIENDIIVTSNVITIVGESGFNRNMVNTIQECKNFNNTEVLTACASEIVNYQEYNSNRFYKAITPPPAVNLTVNELPPSGCCSIL